MPDSHISLNRIVGRPRWKESEAREVLAALDASGLSVAAFAARHSIQAQRIYLWKRRLAQRAKELAPRRAAFVEVSGRAAIWPAGGTRYEIVTRGGDALRIEGPVDTDAVRALIEVLRATGSC